MNRPFTKTFLESLRPAAKRQFFLCSRTPGLGLVVYPSGTKRFFYRRTVATFDTGRIPVGTWRDGRIPDMTIKEASDRCGELNAMVNAGINPAQERRDRKAAPTFGDLYERYLSDHVQINNTSDTRAKSLWKLYLKQWKNIKVADITPSDISTLFAGIARAKKHATANHVLAMVRAMFEHAANWGYMPEGKANPAARQKKLNAQPRSRKLENHEFPAFMAALNGYHHRTPRDAILLALLTGQRIGNILSMKWSDINISDKVWTIPKTKTGHSSRLPLSDAAVKILESRLEHYRIMDRAKGSPSRKARDEQRRERMLPFVFRGRSKCGHVTNINRGWQEIRDLSGIQDIRIHDLRRTFISLNANSGTSLIVTSRLASHRDTSTTAKVYINMDDKPKRKAVNETAETIRKLS